MRSSLWPLIGCKPKRMQLRSCTSLIRCRILAKVKKLVNTFDAAIFFFSRSTVVVVGSELSGMSMTIVIPPAAAAFVAVSMPILAISHTHNEAVVLFAYFGVFYALPHGWIT